ncbi:MAG: tRNA pseudouridine(13) synthase TruD [Promethearchaeota archaeon]
MRGQEYETHIGMKVYTTPTPGIGGRLRKTPEDFVVQEIGLDDSIAPLEPSDQEFVDQLGKFTAFFLVKRNLDSIQAIRRLSRSMGVSYKRFSYAGIKDRRAVTSQRVSYRGAPHDLVGREDPQLLILHPHRVPRSIVPGALKGNRFTIIVRDVALSAREVQQRLEKVQQEIRQAGGVLNFFGPQRFGVTRPNTHLIGKEIVQGNFEEAVRILLEDPESSKDDEESTLIEDFAPGTYERAIGHYLNKHPGRFKDSFQVLPKDLVRLYVHAYQSFIFNQVISERVARRISLQEPIVGDFTMAHSGEIHTVRMVTEDTQPQTQQEVENGTRILVVPLIGFDFEHVPLEGSIGEIINSILKTENITPSHFRIVEMPGFSSRGTFRPLLITPDNLQLVVIGSNDDTSVRVQFDLPKGGYASVILREFMKPDSPTQL